MKFTIEGNDCMPPVSGGYLIILLDNKEIHVASVPSPILANRYRDSIVENDDTFGDPDGNEYSISIWSSKVGVDWQLDITSNSDKENFEDRITVEYHANEF